MIADVNLNRFWHYVDILPAVSAEFPLNGILWRKGDDIILLKEDALGNLREILSTTIVNETNALSGGTSIDGDNFSTNGEKVRLIFTSNHEGKFVRKTMDVGLIFQLIIFQISFFFEGNNYNHYRNKVLERRYSIIVTPFQ